MHVHLLVVLQPQLQLQLPAGKLAAAASASPGASLTRRRSPSITLHSPCLPACLPPPPTTCCLRRYIVKQLSRSERQSFLEFAPDYFRYVATMLHRGQETCLAKVLGVYQVGCQKWKQCGRGGNVEGYLLCRM